MLSNTAYTNASHSTAGQLTLLPGQAVASTARHTKRVVPCQQLCFDWDSDESTESGSDAITTHPHRSPSQDATPAANSSPSIRRVRKLKRISIRNTVRDVPGGELWETPELSKPVQEETAPPRLARVSRTVAAPHAAKLQQRIAAPVRIGATMLKLLKGYGITDAEIAAGIAAYAERTCHATAS